MPKSKNRKKKRQSQSHGPARPAPKRKPPSPQWYVITMFALMGLGVLLVVLNYIFVFFGGWGLWVGLAALAGGFFMTTNYR
ncbi:MAG: cell division protein CrgA [Gammaproteobacteria bacterium]|nr:cell division protein CrgA [Gammaproteobacteria bacterium]